MFRKELQDTLRTFVGILVFTAGVTVFSFFVVRHIFGITLAFRDIFLPITWTAMFLIGFYLGSTPFSEERTGKVFEYFYSLPVARWQVLFYKVFPRFLAFLIFFLLHLVFYAIIYKNQYSLMHPGIFFLLSLSIFLFSVSKSLMYKRTHTILIANILVFSLIFIIIWSLAKLFKLYNEQIIFGYFTLIFGVISLALFIGFVIRFKSFDMSNMLRMSRKNAFQVMLPVAVFFLLYIVVNQVDSGKPADMFTQRDLVPASFDKANGFYRLCTLPEPPGTDVEADAVINKYRKLFDPQFDNEKFMRQFDRKSYRRTARKLTETIRLGIETKWGIRPDVWKYLASQEADLERKRQECSFILERYRKLVNTPLIEDFSPIFHYWTQPIFDLLAWLRVAKFYVAVNAVDAVNGQWEQGTANILAHIAFTRKVTHGSRIMVTNLVGKTVAVFSLQMLAVLMNRDDCPKEIYKQILESLPPLKPGDFSTKNSFIFETLAFARYLDKDIYEKIQQHGEFFDRLGRDLLTQENRTVTYLHQYLKKAIHFEDTPPFRWEADISKIRSRKSQGPCWWLINPVGKLIFEDWAINYYMLILRTYRVRTFYDMIRISAELHLKDDPAKPVIEVLKQLDTYKNTIDPCSGKPYAWNPQKQVLYSIGTDRKDDSGKYDITTPDTDFAVPVRLKGRKYDLD